jgi:hypothetical protein
MRDFYGSEDVIDLILFVSCMQLRVFRKNIPLPIGLHSTEIYKIIVNKMNVVFLQ